MWSEILAYELSFHFGVPVPPAFAAIDSNTGEAGVLIELFYRYPRPTARLVHAADYMQDHFIAGRKGRPHAVRENLALCRALKAPAYYEWWAKAVLFDSLLGNVDRHSENWGFIFERKDDAQSVTLAPLYDNGTSLGYNILEERLDPAWALEQIEQFVRKGKHDCGWSHKEDGPMLNIELCRRFFTTFPQYVPRIDICPEPDNTFDPNAVACQFEGAKIGNINRLQAAAYGTWAKQQRVSAVVDRLNGTEDRPRLFLFVEISALPE